jgi:hypothetical protein
VDYMMLDREVRDIACEFRLACCSGFTPSGLIRRRSTLGMSPVHAQTAEQIVLKSPCDVEDKGPAGASLRAVLFGDQTKPEM